MAIGIGRTWFACVACAWALAAGAAADPPPGAFADPTRPTAKMADRLKARLTGSEDLKIRALVVGAANAGVALLGADAVRAAPVRRGSVVPQSIDGVKVDVTIRAVTAEGVELATDSLDAPLFLPGSYAALPVPENPPADLIRYLECENVPLERAMRLIADQSGVNVSVTDAAAKKTASIFLRNVGAAAAVEEICRASGLWYRREEGANVIRVTTLEEYAENLNTFREESTETFTLLYPNVIEVASVIYGLYPDRTLLSLGEEEFEEDDEYDLSRRFRRFRVLDDNGGSSFMDVEAPDASTSSARGGTGAFSFSRGNAFSQLGQWDQLRERARGRRFAGRGAGVSASEAAFLDRARQAGDTNLFESAKGQAALGQANIFVTLSRKNNLLVVRTSDVQVRDEIRRLVRRLDVPTPMVLMEVRVLELDVTDDYAAGVKWTLSNASAESLRATHLAGTDADALENALAKTLLGSQTAVNPTFTFAAVGDHVKTQIDMMQKDGKVRTLATPTLLVANNEVSRIFSGKEYPLVAGWTKADTVGTDGVVVQGQPTVQIEKKDVGTMLLITPNINADKTVTLRLLQENSAVSDQKVEIPVTGGTGETKAIEYVESRSLTGTFVAKDGLLVMAGGLISEREEEVYWRTPVLGSVPYLGWLFRGTEKKKRRTELVVLIRPHVISTPVEGGRISGELMKALSAHPAADGRPAMGTFKEDRPHTPKDDAVNAVR